MSAAIPFYDLPPVLYLTMDDVKSVGLTDEEFINCISDIFVQQGLAKVDRFDERFLRSGKQTIMCASGGLVDEAGIAGFKWFTMNNENWKKGLHRSMGMIILNDPNSGLPYAIMDAFFITVKRAAATIAVSAKYFARKNSTVLGLIGSGAQARDNLRMLQLVLPRLIKVKVFDSRPGAAHCFQRTMADEFRGEIIPTRSIEEAVTDVDILVSGRTINNEENEIVLDKWLPSEGLFLSPLMPLDLYETRTLQRMDKVVVDDMFQVTAPTNSGEISGVFKKIYAQQAEISIGKKAAREHDYENILALNLGLSVHDVYIARKIYEVAREKGIGSNLGPLTW
jgi:ornithine cyclodeaminase/alanine dehydrogenase-like protein (mu-crystallin family)